MLTSRRQLRTSGHQFPDFDSATLSQDLKGSLYAPNNLLKTEQVRISGISMEAGVKEQVPILC